MDGTDEKLEQLLEQDICETWCEILEHLKIRLKTIRDKENNLAYDHYRSIAGYTKLYCRPP